MKFLRTFSGLPVASLLLLLQRSPVVRLAVTAGEFVAPTRIVSLLKATIATAASLGAVQTLAGATRLVASDASPVTVNTGTPVQIALVVTGAQTAALSWTIAGAVAPGLTFSGVTSGNVNVSTLVLSGTPTTPGTYTASLRAWQKINGAGDKSSLFPYTVVVTSSGSSGPSITTQPAAQSVVAGTTVSFSVVATGNPTPAYQWRKDNVNLAGATGASLTLASVSATAAGSYQVVVTNSVGSVTSAPAALTILTGSTRPTLTSSPPPQYVASGAAATFAVTATGAGLSYQWQKDGVALPGATQAAFTLPFVTGDDMGFYSAIVTGGGTSLTSAVATLTVDTGGTSRLVNVSTRGYVPPGGALTPGFVLQGNATKALVIRAVGPTLGAFGVNGTLPEPVMDVIRQGETTAIASNAGWGGQPMLMSAFKRVGAFPLAASTSADSAVATTLQSTGVSGYTVRITSRTATGAGIALAEVYDDEGIVSPVRLVNVSTIGFVGTGDQALVPGFVIGGDAPKQLLIRAVGPGLAPFGVPDTLADPQLSLVPLGQDFNVAANDNWGGSAALQAAFTAAGAFALPTSSKDAVVLVRLPPGAYTVVVSGVGNTTGTALVEVYDLDP